MLRSLFPILLSLCVGLAICFPFFRTGYFSTDDGEWAIVRLAEMKRELRDGQIPPRWSGFLNHGNGYPLFLFTYPFPFYIGAMISGMGVGLTTTIKMLFVVSTIVSGIGMYYLAKEFSGIHGGIIASLLYLLVPFRMVDLYQRGSIGETMSMAIFPFLCWLGVLYLYKPTRERLALVSVVLSMLLVTHNAMALLFLPFWGIFMIVIALSCGESFFSAIGKRILPICLLGGSMASFFVLPAMLEKRYIALSQIPLADISEHFLSWRDLLSIPGVTSGNELFSLGIWTLVAYGMSLLSFLWYGPIDKQKYKSITSMIIVFVLVCWLLLSKPSLIIWQSTLLSSIDFPWRLLPVLSFFLVCGSMTLGTTGWSRVLGYIMVGVGICMVLPRISIEHPVYYPDSYYETNDATTTSADELMPIWVKQKPTNRSSEYLHADVPSNISLADQQSHRVEATVTMSDTSQVTAQGIYFPGWRVFVDGKAVTTKHDNPSGRITFPVEKGTHTVSLQFSKTPIRYISDILSLIGCCVFFWMWFPRISSIFRRQDQRV